MANEIGQALLDVPNSPQSQDQATGLFPTQPQIPADVKKDPMFQRVAESLKKPENMMTAIVLLGSMMQDRRPGQSKIDAIAERALGTLGFRGELQKRNEADVDEAAKLQSEIGYKQGQLDIGKERNVIEREHIGAVKENTSAQLAGQERMNTQDNQTRLMIAQMENGWRRYMADLEMQLGELKAGGGGFGLDDKTIVDIFKNYADGVANGVPMMTPPETVQFIIRTKVGSDPRFQKQVGFRMFKGPDGKQYVDVDPQWRPLFGIPSEGPATTPTPAPVTKPKAATKPSRPTAPKGVTVVPPQVPWVGLPNPSDQGQSYVIGGSHTAPPGPARRNEFLYPGTK